MQPYGGLMTQYTELQIEEKMDGRTADLMLKEKANQARKMMRVKERGRTVDRQSKSGWMR